MANFLLYSLQLRNCTIIFFSNWIDSNTSYSFLKDSKNCSMTLTLKGWISFQHTQTVFIFALWSMYFFILSLKSKNTMGWIQRMAVIILFMCNVFCKWIRLQNILYFCIFNYVRGDKQKVWSKAENKTRLGRDSKDSQFFFSPLTRLTGVWGLHILHMWDA